MKTFVIGKEIKELVLSGIQKHHPKFEPTHWGILTLEQDDDYHRIYVHGDIDGKGYTFKSYMVLISKALETVHAVAEFKFLK